MSQSQLQVTFEVVFGLDTVYNLDLFQKGWYKLKIYPENEKKAECRRYPNGPKEESGIAEFTPTYIRYRREERKIAEAFMFQIHRLVSTKPILGDNPLEIEAEFTIELWFGEDDGEEGSESVSTRKLHILLKPTVHDVCTVTFDYGFMLTTRLIVHGAITIINQPYSVELMADHESNRLERALLHRAEMEDNDLMDDEMVASYMCSGQLRIIRQLHWTIKALKDAIRLASRVSDANPPLIRSEAEISDDERKYLNNVLDKTRIPENARNSDRAAIQEKIRTDVVDMIHSNLAKTCGNVMNAWKSFLDCYLKDKNWKRDLSVKNRGLRMERYVSGSISFMNIVKLSKNKHSLEYYDQLRDKMVASTFWGHLPRPPVLVQETDGYNADMPIIIRDCYEKDPSVGTTPVSMEDLVINDVFDQSKVNNDVVDKFIQSRRNPNDVDFEKEELRIAHLSSFEPINQSFAAQRQKNMRDINVQGDFIRPVSNVLAAKESHLIIMLHGLEGNSNDLRLWKTSIEQIYPLSHFEYLLCQSNHNLTQETFEEQGKRITEEVSEFLLAKEVLPEKISWVGHSMGALLVRIAANSAKLEPFRPLFEDFVSLCGPHTGLYYMDSAVVGAGLWLYEKWKKAASLKQLALRDASQVSDTSIFKMASSCPLSIFKRVLLVSAAGDRYVSPHSARIESPKSAFADKVNGTSNILIVETLQKKLEVNKTIVERYHVFHQNLPQDTATKVIGRAAHIAVLDSQVFISAFLIASRAFNSGHGKPVAL